jgi:hypothetical protein
MVTPVGTIRGVLELESAAFIRELRRASAETARHTSAMQRSMVSMQSGFARAGAAIKGAVLGFASVATVRAIAQLGKAAITSADEIAAASRRIGVSAEDLQRFRFAAGQADVEVGELTNAFRVFQKQLAQGKIQAEGGTVLEKFNDVLKQLEDAPDRMAAVRIATEAFGRGSGAAMQIAASGVDEFIQNLKEAHVTSNNLIAVGDKLDDQWDRIRNAFAAGFQTGFLETFANSVSLTAKEVENFHKVASALGGVVGTVIGWVGSIANAFANLRTTVFNAREEIRKIQAERAGLEFIPSVDGLSQSNRPLPQFQKPLADLPDFGEGLNVAKAAAESSREAANAQRDWNSTMQEGMSVWADTLGPLGTYQNELNKLRALQEQGAISAETFGTAQRMAAATAVQPWLQVAGTVAGALGELFGENKAVAIAQAIINTAQGITAALAQGGMFGWAQAAAIAAAGAAQIATIASTKPGSSKSPKVSKAGGGKGGGAEEKVGESTGGGPKQSVTLVIKGDVFGPEHFRKIVKGINGVTQDGTVMFRTA